MSTRASHSGQVRTADAGNWQARGQEFAVGQAVRLILGKDTDEGRVVAVWPGIGMVDVQWPHTSARHPVEDLQIVNAAEDVFIAPMHEDVPGGPGSSANVSQGAVQDNVIFDEDPRVELVQNVDDLDKQASTKPSVGRVVAAFVKKSLYWHSRDRKYRVSREEHGSGSFNCPTRGCDGIMRRATYKMENGSKVRLHACPSCLFMIRTADILSDHCEQTEEC